MSAPFQLAVTRPIAGDANHVRVWSVRSDGHLVSAWQDAGNNWYWTDHGVPPTSTVSNLTAVTFDLSSNHHERVWGIGADGRLYEYNLLNGVGTWYSMNPPSGQSFTGRLGALTGTWSGTRYVALGLTTTSGRFYTAVGTGSTHSLSYTNRGTGYETGQIAATTSPNESVWTFFTRKTDGTAGWVRWTGSAWTTGNAGRPTDTEVGRSMVAAQGDFSSGQYHLHLWTTAFPTLDSTLRVAVADCATCTTFTWTYTNIGSFPDANYSLTATARPYPPYSSYVALDAFTLAADRIYRDTASIDGWPFDAVDLGTAVEVSGTSPAAVAMSTNFGYSRFAWVGEMQNARYLYSRASDFGPDDLWRFLAHGEGLPRRRVDGASTLPHTEVMMDDWRGKAIAAAMVRPNNMDGNPNDDYSYVQAMWSNDDGETWGMPVTVPSTVGGFTYNYVADPTVAFTDTGTAYVLLLGNNNTGNCQSSNRRAVYFTTTTDGVSYTTPFLIQGGPAFTALDHSWMDIDRSRSPDRLHFVWWNTASPVKVQYQCMDHGATCPSTSTDCCQAPCNAAPCLGPLRDLSTSWNLGAGFPTLSVGGDGGVYVAWSGGSSGVRVCRLNSTLSACATMPSVLAGNLLMDPAPVPIPATGGGYIRADQGWSIAAAQHPLCPQTCSSCGVLYYAFHRQEATSFQKDVYVSRGVYCLSNPGWTWSTPALVPTVSEDGTDQFNPTVTVLSDGRQGFFDDNIFVSWYDRRELCNATTFNRCLRLRGAISTSGGLSFSSEHVVQTGALTDPWLLPFHCSDPTLQRFIGDYHEHAGNLLHSHYVWSAAPEGGAPTTGQLWQSFVAFGNYHY